MLTWIAISLSIASLIFIDVSMTRRHKLQFTISDAVVQSAFWLSIGLAFGFYIYFSYEYNLFSIFSPSEQSAHVLDGKDAVSQYFTIYFLERTLSFDNLFIILIIFQTLKIPTNLQYRILFYGIVIAILARSVIILAGVNLLEQYYWLHYFVAAIIFFSSIKLIAHTTLPLKDKYSGLAKTIMLKFPVYQNTQPANSPQSITDSKRFFLKRNGKWFITPMLVALLCIEYTDLIFSFDSLPTALSVSNSPFIILSASILALLGLRALYFIFSCVIIQLQYIKFAIVIILLLSAFRAAMFDIYPIHSNVMLLILSSVLTIGGMLSLLHRDRNEKIELPFVENIGRLYQITYKTFRRLVVTLVGVSVIIVGIIMIVTPGPAIIVIPAGLAILATEFVWARLLLKKIKDKLIYYGKESKAYFKRDDNKNN
ncbi:hypothetical protein MNBD_GAMMA21-1884 [hydrothermal vent metagenome]|uniref:Integral membrane protein TerC n=1 Tax=hydrothermal vent metagenome TaxID=652676 RepID=A0A3B1A1I5_9ZZZZ